MNDKKKNMITVLCLLGIIICILSILVLRLIKLNPKKQFDKQLIFAYTNMIRKYESDKADSLVTDGKYSSKTIVKKGVEINYVAEFDTITDNLTHFCLSNGSKIIDLNYDNITLDYIKEHNTYERSTETCELN